MIKWRIFIFVFSLLMAGVSYTQSSGTQLIGEDGRFWTLPATECDGDTTAGFGLARYNLWLG
jgi:hypothetical protein